MLNGLKNQNTVLAVGRSIFNKSNKTPIGDVLLTYGGGGHDAAGTCQVSNDSADRVLRELVDVLGSAKVPSMV